MLNAKEEINKDTLGKFGSSLSRKRFLSITIAKQRLGTETRIAKTL
jgi:hypothetical protein